jgi:hypothetical protein
MRSTIALVTKTWGTKPTEKMATRSRFLASECAR